MNIPEKIESIITERNKHLPAIEKSLQNLEKANSIILRFEEYRKNISDSLNTDFSISLNNINLEDYKKQFQKTKEKLDLLYKRFSRKHINISFVGKAGQGKSLVMQKISGLSRKIIPSSNGPDCTGTKSIITNDDSDKVNAQITFYSEKELVQIINTYLEKILEVDFIPISSVNALKSLDINEIENKINSNADKLGMFKHLKDYIEKISEFEEYLGKKIIVSENEIEQYVAQYESTNPNNKYYKYLGVKEANIHCAFPFKECGKIVLVDTIGLGATTIGVQENMLETVKKDSDVILYMFRPDPLRPRLAQDDFNIINDIKNTVSVEYAKKLLFWVFNRVESGEGKNTNFIKDLRKEIENNINRDKLAVSETFNVNCSDNNDVKDNLLIPILQKMSGSLNDIDNLLLKEVNAEIQNLFNEFNKLTAKLKNSYSGMVSEDIKRRFTGNIKVVYSDWTNKLRDLWNDLANKRNTINKQLKAAIENKKENIYKFIPSEADILNGLNVGNYPPNTVYEGMADYLRVSIIEEFQTLDECLDKIVNDIKKKIIDILSVDGKLNSFVETSTMKPNLWIEDLQNKIIDNKNFDKINKGLEALKAFSLSVKGSLIFIIRNSLDGLDPYYDYYQSPRLDAGDKEMKAKSIHKTLEKKVLDFIKIIEDPCNEYLKLPNNAIFAVTRDFHDQMTYKGKPSDLNDLSVDRQWEYLYEDHIPEIWSEKYIEQAGLQKQNQDFEAILNIIKEVNNKESFLIRF